MRPEATHLKIGGDAYAIGLVWRLAGDEEDLFLQARRTARLEGFDYVAPIPPEGGRLYAQFGLARRSDGHRWRMRSAAAALVQRGGSLAGAFPLRKSAARFWFVVIREGLVMADMLCDADTARDRLFEAAAATHNLRIFAPADWALPGAAEIDIPLLFGDTEGRVAARLVLAKRAQGVLLIGAVAASVAIGSLLLPFLWLALFPASDVPPPTPPPPDRVWEAMPKPALWLDACRSGMAQLPMALQGWQFRGAVCERDQVTVEWERKAGTLGFVPQNLVIDAGAQRARMGVRIGSLPARGHEDLWDRNQLTKRILARVPDANWTERSPAPIESQPAGLAPARRIATPWKLRDISFTSPKDWLAAVRFIDATPGAVLTRITLTESGWKIEGVIYELG